MRLTLYYGCLFTLLQVSCAKSRKSAAGGVCDSWPTTQTGTKVSPALDRAVSDYLSSLDPKQPIDTNARAIKAWFDQQPCVRQTILPTTAVQTEPPGLDIAVMHQNGSRRTFSILFFPNKVRLSYSY